MTHRSAVQEMNKRHFALITRRSTWVPFGALAYAHPSLKLGKIRTISVQNHCERSLLMSWDNSLFEQLVRGHWGNKKARFHHEGQMGLKGQDRSSLNTQGSETLLKY